MGIPHRVPPAAPRPARVPEHAPSRSSPGSSRRSPLSVRHSVESETCPPSTAVWWRPSSSAWARFTAPKPIPTIKETSTSARSSSHGLDRSTPRTRPTRSIRSAVRCSSTAPACPTIPAPYASSFKARSHRLRCFTGKVPRFTWMYQTSHPIIPGSRHLLSTRHQITRPRAEFARLARVLHHRRDRRRPRPVARRARGDLQPGAGLRVGGPPRGRVPPGRPAQPGARAGPCSRRISACRCSAAG